MLALIIIVGIIVVGYEAVKHFNAENYASQKVYGNKTGFFDFMFSRYPVLTGIIIFVAVVIILGTIFNL